MASLAQNIARNSAAWDGVKEAIGDKGQMIPPNTPVEDYPAAIRAIQSGGGAPDPRKPIRFIDFDGTPLYSFDFGQIAAMESLPAPPARDGLVFQSWNWPLANLKATRRDVVVGPLYDTLSGRTELDLALTNASGLGVKLIVVSAGGTIAVDWGDGSAEDTTAQAGQQEFNHAYASAGRYTASIGGDGYDLYGSVSPQLNMFGAFNSQICTGARVGSGCARVLRHAFSNCSALRDVTLTEGVQITYPIFLACRSLRAISMPASSPALQNNSFNSCWSLALASLPYNMSGMANGGIFQYCGSLQAITIPDSETSLGGSTMASCSSLRGPLVLPASIASIGHGAFENCSAVSEYVFLRAAPPTMVAVTAFTGILSSCVMWVPKGLLAAYQTAANWSTYSGHMREMDDDMMEYYGLAPTP